MYTMIEVLGVFLCVLIVFLFAVLRISTRPVNFPPGPTPLPIIGNFYHLPSISLFSLFEKWRKIYGSIIGIIVVGKPFVLIDGVDNVLAALRKEEFQSRPDSFAVKARTFGKNLGIFFSIGDQWASSRKFVIKQMRAYGRTEKESIIADEVEQLIERIKEDKCIQGNGFVGVAAVNVIWAIIANKRLDFKDQKSQQFLQNLNLMFRQGSSTGGGDIENFIPIFRFFSSKFKFSQKVIREIQQFIKDTIQEHREVIDHNNPMDLIDHYLVEMEFKNKGLSNPFFTDEDLISIGMDLFSAGAESTSNSIDFILLYMILHPEAQQKMQEELDRVLGRSRKPRLEDKTEMHFTMAVITEVERLNSIAPTNVPHYTTKDTTFGGYFIPKGTTISMNLRSLGYDPKYWKNPEEFYPERFLGVDSKFSRPAHLALFGLGQRACVGEVFARNIIFLFTATIFEKFSFSLPLGEPKPSTEPLTGFTTAPQPFNISIKRRY